MKKIIKIIGQITFFESIMGYVVCIILIAGVMGIIALTNYNPYISAPLCIVFVLAVLIIHWKIKAKVSDIFKKDKSL
jgi:uncharacterized membrane protein